MENNSIDCEQFKVMILGSFRAGKTALIHKLTRNNTKNDIPQTVGLEYTPFYINHRDRRLCLQIWDVSGQEKYIDIAIS